MKTIPKPNRKAVVLLLSLVAAGVWSLRKFEYVSPNQSSVASPDVILSGPAQAPMVERLSQVMHSSLPQDKAPNPFLQPDYVGVSNEADFSKRFHQACEQKNWGLADRLVIAFAYRLNEDPDELTPAHLRRTLEILSRYVESEPEFISFAPEWTEYRFIYRAMLGDFKEANAAYSELKLNHAAFMQKSRVCYEFYRTQKDPSVSWAKQDEQVRLCMQEGKGFEAVQDLLGPLLLKGEYQRARNVYAGYLMEFPNSGLIPLELFFRDIPTEDRPK